MTGSKPDYTIIIPLHLKASPLASLYCLSLTLSLSITGPQCGSVINQTISIIIFIFYQDKYVCIHQTFWHSFERLWYCVDDLFIYCSVSTLINLSKYPKSSRNVLKSFFFLFWQFYLSMKWVKWVKIKTFMNI